MFENKQEIWIKLFPWYSTSPFCDCFFSPIQIKKVFRIFQRYLYYFHLYYFFFLHLLLPQKVQPFSIFLYENIRACMTFYLTTASASLNIFPYISINIYVLFNCIGEMVTYSVFSMEIYGQELGYSPRGCIIGHDWTTSGTIASYSIYFRINIFISKIAISCNGPNGCVCSHVELTSRVI